MRIHFPSEVCQPTDDGFFQRRRCIAPVPNKQITIEEEWHVQDDGTLLVLEAWHLQPSAEDTDPQLKREDAMAEQKLPRWALACPEVVSLASINTAFHRMVLNATNPTYRRILIHKARSIIASIGGVR